MKYEGFTTFSVAQDGPVMRVTFDFGTVNVQGQEMLADLNSLAMRLERDRDTKVVIFQSANPEIWVCHYDTELLKDMSVEAVSRDEAQLLDLQAVCERIRLQPATTGGPLRDNSLVELLGRAFQARATLLNMGETEVRSLKTTRLRHLQRLAKLSYLEPSIVRSILKGTQPKGLGPRGLWRMADLPIRFADQRSALSFPNS